MNVKPNAQHRRVVVVTGGARGIGRAIAEAILAEGGKVAINGRSEEKGAQALKEMDAGDNAIFVQGDVQQRADVDRIVDTTVETFGTIDIMVNNAGGSPLKVPAVELPRDEWDRTLALNVTAVAPTDYGYLQVYPFGAETAAEALVNGLADRGELTLDFILRALHNGEIQLFITALANRARIEIPTARRIVLDAGGEPLAVLCRAVGMEQGQFASTYLLTRSPHGNALGTMVTPKVAELFGSLTREAAMAALRYWKQDDEFLRAQSDIARVSSGVGA